MDRLQAELQRLYLSQDAQREAPGPEEPGLVRPDGRVRAIVLELARPASWDSLEKVWQGVQVDLELPAPSIAVSGIDGYQLWFSMSQSISVGEAVAFLELLRRRYLGDIAPDRIGRFPPFLEQVDRRRVERHGEINVVRLVAGDEIVDELVDPRLPGAVVSRQRPFPVRFAWARRRLRRRRWRHFHKGR